MVTTWYRLSLGTVVALAAIASAQRSLAGQEDNAERVRLWSAPYRTVDFGIRLFDGIATDGFVDLSFDELPWPLLNTMDSKLWLCCSEAARPIRVLTREKVVTSDSLRVRAHAAENGDDLDLVEFTWTASGQMVRALARLDALRIDLDLEEAKANPKLDRYGDNLRERVRGLVGELIKLEGRAPPADPQPYRIVIPWPESVVDGVQFSTDPEVIITTMDSAMWHRRLDGYVHGTTLSLLFYMKPGQLLGFRDGSQWFDDDFRALVHRKAREQGKRAPAPSEARP